MLKKIINFTTYTTLFISGLATGIAIGFLTAPKSGKEFSRDLTDKLIEINRKTKNRLYELEDKSKAQLRKFGHVIRDSADILCLKLDELATKKDSSLVNEEFVRTGEDI